VSEYSDGGLVVNEHTSLKQHQTFQIWKRQEMST
jgi:hypothetical protein